MTSIDPILARNFREFERGLKKLSKLTEQSTGELLWKYSPVFANTLMKFTHPFRKGEKPEELGARSLSIDISRAYPSISKVWKVLEKKDKNMADAAYKAYKKGDVRTLQRILGVSSFSVGRWDNGAHHKQQRNSRGRVGRRVSGLLIMGGDNEVKSYIKKKAELVGYTKAGWIAGLPSHRLKGTSVWNRRNRKGQGRVTDRSKNGVVRAIDFENNVPWIQQKFFNAGAEIAINRLSKRIMKELEKEQQKLKKKV